MIKNLKRGKGRSEGSVLFTVVMVMMVMVVFLMSTLTLTTSANRRSYYTYYQTQSQYAAQAALDAITNSAYSNRDFYRWVSNNVNRGDPPKPITVDFDNTHIQFTNETSVVNCTIERVEDNYIYDDTTNAIHPQRAWKITATASVGRGRNTAEYTFSNYIYENYQPDAEDVSVDAHNAATGETYNYTYTPPAAPGTGGGSLARAVYSFTPAAANNNFTYLGPQYSGMCDIPAGRINYDSASTVDLANDTAAVGTVQFINNFKSAVNRETVFQKVGAIDHNQTMDKWTFPEHATFYGNVTTSNKGNGSLYFKSVVNLAEQGQLNYQDMNYVYIDGRLTSSGGDAAIGYDKMNDGSNKGTLPVNLYAGAVTCAAAQDLLKVYGDVFLYDPDLDSVWRGDGATNLAKFVGSNVEGKSIGGTIGGNLYCNNQSLTIGNMTIDGDLIFSNPSGTLTISENLTVSGKVVCAGTLLGKDKLTCSTIVAASGGNATNWTDYRDADYAAKNASYTTSVPVKTVTVDDPTNLLGYDFSTDWHDGWTGIWDNSYPEGPGWYHFNYGTKDVSTAMDYSLFPYEFRLDEMFDKYYRWDLKSTVSEQDARDTAAADLLVKESIACGHNWTGVDTYSVNGTTYYVPYTFPVDSNNCFMQHFEPVANRTTATAALTGTNTLVYDTYADFDAIFRTSTKKVEAQTDLDAYTGIPVYARGAVADNIDAYVINQNCEIDLSKFNGKTIFVDPSGRTDASPLCIAVKGWVSGTGVNIIINNTANYTGTNYASATPYTTVDGGTPKTQATRRQVVFYYMDGFGGDKPPYFLTTGLFGSTTFPAEPTGSAVSNLETHVVSNPTYPEEAAWATLTDENAKWAFELVPNSVTLGAADKTYNFTNGYFANSEIIMPNSILANGNPETTKFTHIYYREEVYDEEYDCVTSLGKNGGLPVAVIGSVMIKEYQGGSNYGVAAYVGDSHRAAGGGETSQTFEANNNSSGLGEDNRDYFSNDHLGQN